MLRRSHAFAFAVLLAGCAVPPNPLDVARFNASILGAADGDRTKSARIAAGLSAAHSGMTLACTMVWDGAEVKAFEVIRRYCAARRALMPGALPVDPVAPAPIPPQFPKGSARSPASAG
ncbi:MAG: hypothetical protein AAF371_19105 [Pseudomonadota bacterium]